MLELADIWIDQTGGTGPWWGLSYSRNSRFIQFVVAVLTPVKQIVEVSPDGLSRRWERLVAEVRHI
ncbi:hypothetical protein [Cribrihabitans marinus]|uniref:hypothetical protein n=1 Tax=Cribrihabitans marinus TaxID=1227549 RepID=UPI001663C3D3|nr:hypothetical protein [Cribrihabitans marinus]GGH41522.1 hypothetical protein GCM10010973_38500 [Cribrihabitans marinus]